jgi:type II secretory pathway pseudopilin PulG
MVKPKYCNLMDLQRQSNRGAEGYMMAALLVALAVMGVLMSAAIPAWRHQAKREKEAELIFRGEQYARAISLWERKMGPGSRPGNVDILVQQRFLRKKYKDPMTEDGEFQPILMGSINQNQNQEGVGGRAGQRGGGLGRVGASPIGQSGAGAQAGGGRTSSFQIQSQFQQSAGRGGQFGGGGLLGVRSKSKAQSIRLYKNRNHYNEWDFVHAGAANAPGGGVGAPTPGGRGGSPRPGAPPGRGGVGPGGRGPGGRGPGPGGPMPQPPGPPGRGRGPGM